MNKYLSGHFTLGAVFKCDLSPNNWCYRLRQGSCFLRSQTPLHFRRQSLLVRLLFVYFLASLLSCTFQGLAQAGGTPSLSNFYCATATPAVGATTDICTVKLGGVSPSASVPIGLSSSNPAVSLPVTVTMPANSSSLQFTASLSSVLAVQTATLTASTGASSMNTALQLPAATQTLAVGSTALSYQYVAVNAAATQPVTLTSTGTLPITIGSVTATGAGFSVSGAALPLTLNPGQTTTLTVQFAPAATGAATGQVTIASNSTASQTATINLSGTGGTAPLSNFHCATANPYYGASTDTCTVNLGGVSPSAPVTVSLSSSSPAVSVPATVTLPANTTSIQFPASVSSALTAQTVTLAASYGTSSLSFNLQLAATTKTLSVNASSLSFQYVALNAAATQSVTITSTGTQPITISSLAAAGSGFSVSSAALPLTLSPYQTATLTVQFAPTAAGAMTGQVTIASNSTASQTATINLSGTGGTAPLSNFHCLTANPYYGASTDTCTVNLGGVSPSAPVTVSLSSSSPAVSVPATVTLPANTTSIQFPASVSAVLAAQTVTLAASYGTSSLSFNLQVAATTQTLGLSASSLNFQYVAVNAPATQAVTLTSTGTVPITINSVAAAGAGFAVFGAAFPLTLNPGQTTALTVQFAPAAAGAATGQITITSNSTASQTATINLSGTGGTPPLSAFYCASAAVSGSATDICTVNLGGVSTSGPVAVSLSSGNPALTLPAMLNVPANASTLQFTATAATVTTTQTATLTATSGGSSMKLALQLNAYVQTLSVSRTSVAFQNVLINASATQSVILTSTGTAPVTVSAAALMGSPAFTMSGAAAFPLTLNPGQTITLGVQFAPAATGVATGQITVVSNSSTGNTAMVALNGLAVAGGNGTGTPGSFGYTGSALVTTLGPAGPSAAIPGQFFGMTIANLAPNSNYYVPNMTPFPTFPVSTLRLWDVDYWAMIDTYPGQNNWTKLDNTISIAQQNGVSDFIFNFGRPPAWASTNPTDPCATGEGAGTCDAPIMSSFQAFVAQVVQRYCGTIKYYEPWNEPDNPQFWDGTNSQMLAISQQVYQIAKDPANCGCTNGICSANGGVNPNQVLLPPVSNTIDAASVSWLNAYLAAAGNPYPYADIAAFHGYIYSGSQPEKIVAGIQQFQQTLATHGMSTLPLWNTEASWGYNSYFNDQQEASWLMRYHALQAALGVSRFIWYSYDHCTWGTLYSSPICPTTQSPADTLGSLTVAGNAYGTIENWFTGANLTQCEQYQNGLWMCELQRSGGYDAWMLWSSTGTSLSVPVPANLGLTVYQDWQGNLNPLAANVTVTQMPILLETADL